MGLQRRRAARDRLERRERFDELKKWRELLKKRDAEATAAMEALHDFENPQTFEPARLSRRVLRSLQDLLRGERAAGRAFVVRKVENSAPQWRFCLVIVERAKGLGQPDAQTGGPSCASASTCRAPSW
ncbi:hypothetical protein FSC37_08955 [Piscinibacter aquaticus]|uniref:Uncharacterized protein n=1 Tax=Piscinibacter aquaticus TaxID=392597 RepID=A0A5C6U2S6_9BURK|nr:hypothetical protein FSC37_08955 [Piscinibacter aquaticus]